MPKGCKEGEIMTFAFPDGRSEATQVPDGFPVVAPEGQEGL